jgi:hypothetical protein
MIVISDLLQMGHPGFRLMKQNSVITYRQLPTFLDYVTLVYQRFKFYVSQDSNSELEYGSHILDIISALKVLSEDDDPAVVIPTRETLKSLLPPFENECRKMASCFSKPPFVKDFYNELAENLIEASNELMGPLVGDLE